MNVEWVYEEDRIAENERKKNMLKTKIGFLPSNWESWDGSAFSGKWAGRMRDRCVPVLMEIPGLDLVVPSHEMTQDGCVSDVDEGKGALALFKSEDIQGLIIGNMTFGMEVAVGTVLNGLRKDLPILHFATRSGPIAPDGSRSTDTWCGQFMTASAIKRRGFTFIHINTCNPEDDYFKNRIASFTRAICAVSRFKGAKFGQIGTRPQLFESQFWSEENMQKQFSQMVVPMDLATAFSRLDDIASNDPEVLAIVKDIVDNAEIGDEYNDQSIINQARYELSLQRIAKELDVSAMAVNCWTQIQQKYGISGCSTFGRLNDKGLITACEVDLLGAVTMWAVYCAALGDSVPDFIDWTDLHPSEENVWLAWHCGNAAPSLCAAGCAKKLMRNERMIQWCASCHGALEFKLKSGPVTCARLVEYDGIYTLFVGTGEIVDMEPFVRGSYGWVKVNDVFDWENKMVEHGIIHHGVLIHDPLVADALVMFCTYLGIRCVRGA
jgi:L-fucose isomerase-like protein